MSTLLSNADRGIMTLKAARADAESLPFADSSFDLVLGHAVLHLPTCAAVFDEFHRVLRPGGRIAFAGEPVAGRRPARVDPQRSAVLVAPVWRALLRAGLAHRTAGSTRLPRRRTARPRAGAVRRHPCVRSRRPRAPRSAGRLRAGHGPRRGAGGELVRVVQPLEATAQPDDVPMLWRRYASTGYLALQQLDQPRARTPRLPSLRSPDLLLLLTARKG